jgi:ABC-type cobalamin/Fe3+-siderophores transport system ATPase subunit
MKDYHLEITGCELEYPTWLRALARMLKPRNGAVLLDGEDIRGLSANQAARSLTMLPQGPVAPDELTVRELKVRHGKPVVLVLNDLSLAARSADNIVMPKHGWIVASDSPRAVLTAAILREVFSNEAHLVCAEEDGRVLFCAPVRSLPGEVAA